MLKIAAILVILEHGVLEIERAVTLTLSCLWIQSYFNFSPYPGESIIFEDAASVGGNFLLISNTFFLIDVFIRIYLGLDPPRHQDRQDEDIRKHLIGIDSYAFGIERGGMALMIILLHFGRASCAALFPIANILYCWSLIFDFFDEKGDSYEDYSDGTFEIVDDNCRDKGYQAEENDDRLPLIPNCKNYAEESRTETQEYNDISGTTSLEDSVTETQEYNNNFEEPVTETRDREGSSGTIGVEGLGVETQVYDDNIEPDENIPGLEEVEEITKDESDTFSGTSFEMMNMKDNIMQEWIQELDQEIRTEKRNNYEKMVNVQVQMRKEIKELEKKLAAAKQKYRKKLEKVENHWERKLRKVAEKHKEERQLWQEQRFDLFSRLSATASQAEFYYLQAQDKFENQRMLEEEVNDLITKLSAANASSEMYRSLLRDDLAIFHK